MSQYRVLVSNRHNVSKHIWVDLPVARDVFRMILEVIDASDDTYELSSCEGLFPFEFPDVEIDMLNEMVEYHQAGDDPLDEFLIIIMYEGEI